MTFGKQSHYYESNDIGNIIKPNEEGPYENYNSIQSFNDVPICSTTNLDQTADLGKHNKGI